MLLAVEMLEKFVYKCCSLNEQTEEMFKKYNYKISIIYLHQDLLGPF
jgi:gluconate kinase